MEKEKRFLRQTIMLFESRNHVLGSMISKSDYSFCFLFCYWKQMRSEQEYGVENVIAFLPFNNYLLDVQYLYFSLYNTPFNLF